MAPGDLLHPTAGLSSRQCPPVAPPTPPPCQVPCPQTPSGVTSPGLSTPTPPLCLQRRSGRRRSQRDKGHGGAPRGCTAPRPSSTSSSRGAVPPARAGPPPARSSLPPTAGHAPSPLGAPMGIEVLGWGTGQTGTQPGSGPPFYRHPLWDPRHGGGHGAGVPRHAILAMGNIAAGLPQALTPLHLPCSRRCAEVCHPEPEAG